MRSSFRGWDSFVGVVLPVRRQGSVPLPARQSQVQVIWPVALS